MYASNARRVWEDFKERFDKSNLTRVYQLWAEAANLKQVQKESQRVLGVVESNKEPLTLLAGRGQHYKGKKPLLVTACEICGFKNHLTADCYRLVGYPSDFKSKRKLAQSGLYQTGTPDPYQTGMGNSRSTQQGSYQTGMGSSNLSTPNHTGNFRPYANNTTADKPIQDHTKLSNEELDQFRNLLHNKEQQECKANLAGATHHITSCKNILHDLKGLEGFNTIQ
ncbi:hypothetical protein KY289_014691 [Solanum tuberosum]|nr:hypothetical protein KY289_014691 [Solanum tuberosum]